jgi:hypothetical protein
MATSKISERCFITCLLGLTSVTFVTLGNSGIAEKHRVSVAPQTGQNKRGVVDSTLLLVTVILYFTKIFCILLKYSVVPGTTEHDGFVIVT